jgi:hypothetical protein
MRNWPESTRDKLSRSQKRMAIMLKPILSTREAKALLAKAAKDNHDAKDERNKV